MAAGDKACSSSDRIPWARIDLYRLHFGSDLFAGQHPSHVEYRGDGRLGIYWYSSAAGSPAPGRRACPMRSSGNMEGGNVSVSEHQQPAPLSSRSHAHGPGKVAERINSEDVFRGAVTPVLWLRPGESIVHGGTISKVANRGLGSESAGIGWGR
jgi:hypothetical protein